MQKFLVLYMTSPSVIDEWMHKPENERKEAEQQMMTEWNAWVKHHEEMFVDTGTGLGKTKRITSDGVEDVRNDLMSYSIIQANSPDEAAQLFVGSPHFQIPHATIEIMPMTHMSDSK